MLIRRFLAVESERRTQIADAPGGDDPGDMLTKKLARMRRNINGPLSRIALRETGLSCVVCEAQSAMLILKLAEFSAVVTC
jgi:hypothetical protein